MSDAKSIHTDEDLATDNDDSFPALAFCPYVDSSDDESDTDTTADSIDSIPSLAPCSTTDSSTGDESESDDGHDDEDSIDPYPDDDDSVNPISVANHNTDDDDSLPDLVPRHYVDSSEDESELNDHEDRSTATDEALTYRQIKKKLDDTDDGIDQFIHLFLEVNNPDQPIEHPIIPLTPKFFHNSPNIVDATKGDPQYPSQAFQEFLHRYDSDDDDDNELPNIASYGNNPAPTKTTTPWHPTTTPKQTPPKVTSPNSSKNNRPKNRKPTIASTNRKKKKLQRQTPKTEATRRGLPMGLFNLKDARNNRL